MNHQRQTRETTNHAKTIHKQQQQHLCGNSHVFSQQTDVDLILRGIHKDGPSIDRRMVPLTAHNQRPPDPSLNPLLSAGELPKRSTVRSLLRLEAFPFLALNQEQIDVGGKDPSGRPGDANNKSQSPSPPNPALQASTLVSQPQLERSD